MMVILIVIKTIIKIHTNNVDKIIMILIMIIIIIIIEFVCYISYVTVLLYNRTKLLLMHRLSVDIFSYSGPSGILGSEGK